MNTRKTLFWVTIFSIAMGLMESAVVIYLRRIYYPGGFTFPLANMQHDIVVVEIWREAATIIMLLSIGVLAGKNSAEKFAWFIFSFAIWDIFYYVFLFVFLGWPASWFTWDILFLIPVPWVGPVITPLIIALTMILYALAIIYHSVKGLNVALITRERLLLASGSVVTIISFTRDYTHQKGDILYRNIREGNSLFTDLAYYVPAQFDWAIFFAGEGLILLAWIFYAGRMKNGSSLRGTNQ